MEPIFDKAIYEGVDVDFLFENERPNFGDVFLVCGFAHPKFPPSGNFDFGSLHQFGFEQVDDYFGIPSDDDEGDDVTVWLYPLVKGQEVFHHSGPFSGVRFSFNVLRNTDEGKALYLKIIEHSLRVLPAKAFYTLREIELSSTTISALHDDINTIIEYWKTQGIVPGSSEALRLDY